MKDLRKDYNYKSESFKMSRGHEKNFENKLDSAFGKKSKRDLSVIYKMVAVAIIAVLSTVFILNQNQSFTDEPVQEKVENSRIGLGDLSPELKNIEDYYLTSIKLELATLETSADYDAMVNSYLEELQNINQSYTDLERDLNSFGVSEDIINAMIDNLQLRLELLQDLKQKLNHLKQKQDENEPVYQI